MLSSVKQRIIRYLQRTIPCPEAEEIDRLRTRVEALEALEAEVNELRRDSIRIAELVDLVEHALTPGSERRSADPSEEVPH